MTVYGEVILANPNGLTINSGNGNVEFKGLINSGNTYTNTTCSSCTWIQAKDAANTANGTYPSYLATVTSRLENAIVSATAGGTAWLGARRDSSNNWNWETGPEAGTKFWVGSSSSGTLVSGQYANWNSGEPNACCGLANGTNGTGENAMQLIANGMWNDLFDNGGAGQTQNAYVTENAIVRSPLTINPGTGTVTFNAAVGATNPLSKLNVTASNIAVNANITVSGLVDGLFFEGFNTYIGNDLTQFGTISRRLNPSAIASANTTYFTSTTLAVCGVTSNACADTYSYRVTGYFIPKTSGDYVFQVGGDDTHWVFLGTAGQTIDSLKTSVQANSSLSSSTTYYVTGETNWSVASATGTKSLVAGQAYPIYAMMSENGGGDFLTLAFKKSGDTNFIAQSIGWDSSVKISDGSGYYYSGTTTTGVTFTGAVALGANAQINSNSSTVQINGAVSGAGKNFTVNTGTASSISNINITGAVTAAQVSLSAANMTLGGDYTLTTSMTTDVSNAATISGAVKGANVTLTKNGSGSLTLSGTNTYTGNTTINAGSFTISTAGSLNSGDYSGAISNAVVFYYSSSANQILSGVISGAGSIIKDTSASSVLSLTGVNTYTGITTISGGTISVSTLATGGSNSGIGASSSAATNLVINGGTLKY